MRQWISRIEAVSLERHLLAFLTLALTCGVLAFSAQAFFTTAGPLATVWVCNGIALAAMLRSPRAYWPTLAAAVMIGTGSGNFLVGTPLLTAYGLGFANMSETLIAAVIAGSVFSPDSDFDDRVVIGRFMAASVVGVSAAALIAAAILYLSLGAPLLPSIKAWFVPDILGLLVVTPFLLSLRPTSLRRGRWRSRAGVQSSSRLYDSLVNRTATVLAVAALVVATAFVFSQPGAPLLFVIGPLVMMTAFRLPLFGAMLALVACSLVAIVMTGQGGGPIAAYTGDEVMHSYLLQGFIASLVALILPVRGLMGERDRIGAAYAESERKFFCIAEASTSGVMHVDASGRTTWVNHRWEQLTGANAAASNAQGWASVIHPDERDGLALLHARLGDDGRTVQAEFRGAGDGADHWFDVSLTLMRDEDGDDGHVVRLSDISERKAAAAALEDSEELYRLVTENARDIVFRIGLDGAPLYVSTAAKRVLGYDPVELVGRSLRSMIHPDDWPLFARIFSNSLICGDDGELRYRQRCKSGDWLWVEASTRLVCDPVSGEPRELVATVRDVHQRYETEQMVIDGAAKLRESNRLLTLAEGLAQVGNFRVGIDAHSFEASRHLVSMAGFDSRSRLSPRDALRLLDRDDRRILLAMLARARHAGRPCECSVRARLQDGQERHVRIVVQADRDRDGRTIGWFGVARDVTQQVRANAELISARDRARNAAEAKSAFLATMSHEIRTPMTGVLGMIDLMRANPSADDRQRYLETLKRSADLLMAVLDDILDFSKIESGRMRLEKRDFRLEDLAAETARLFDSRASAKGVTLIFTPPDHPVRPVLGDSTRVQQVLSNLLSNAVKFTDEGMVELALSVQDHDGRQTWHIEVRDSGIGMNDAQIEQLFQPFSQVQDAGRNAGGTGLGLAISRRLVDAMGGRIGVKSRPHKGSTFWVELSLPDGLEPAQPATTPLPAPRVAAPPRTLSILVAEDNPVNQMLLGAILQQQGHDVETVGNGRLAVEACEQQHFDAIIMDMQMPEMDGLAATRTIRKSGGANAAIPIIALTADASPERRRFYDGAGLSAFLTKPIDQEALHDQLAAIAAGMEDASAPEPTPCLDDARLAELRGSLGDVRLGQLLGLLADQLRLAPTAMRALLEKGDVDALRREAHGLKGAASNAGASLLAATAAKIEHGEESADLVSLVEQLCDQAGAVIRAIEELAAPAVKSQPA
ncbi:PAS domain S-box protein [Sphingomicrobium flavum]|uniref:PAS domain S-box protein n=1 Tax=Sphingomicrobium flavum TaxID=1229164 RepID=UPI0021AD585F|nr:PAS domain S-box protein [Sphingomicrobium flavum]